MFHASVPVTHQEQGVKFLVLEHDALDTGGWFLYLHASLEEGCLFDEWYENRSLAENSALLSWSVTSDMWKSWEGDRKYPAL